MKLENASANQLKVERSVNWARTRCSVIELFRYFYLWGDVPTVHPNDIPEKIEKMTQDLDSLLPPTLITAASTKEYVRTNCSQCIRHVFALSSARRWVYQTRCLEVNRHSTRLVRLTGNWPWTIYDWSCENCELLPCCLHTLDRWNDEFPSNGAGKIRETLWQHLSRGKKMTFDPANTCFSGWFWGLKGRTR